MRGWTFTGILVGLALRWGFDLATGDGSLGAFFGAALLILCGAFMLLLIAP